MKRILNYFSRIREEMLALYDKSMKAPDDLTVSPPLYSEKTQTPLALIQMSDEEMVNYTFIHSFIFY